jgi:hypothetical protein
MVSSASSQLMRKLAFAAFADALHRVVQAIRVIDAPANGTAAQAGAYLMVAIIIVAGVIRFDPGDFIIAHVQTQRSGCRS